MGMNETIAEARTLRAAGFFCVPIPAGSKGPQIAGWQKLRLEGELIDASFTERLSNIGIILGEPSGWLVDVDLDCAEAIQLAPDYLPATGCITGRDGRAQSHYWYRCENAETARLGSPDGTVVELRSTGLQTVVGPSTHPDGGQYDLLRGEPAVVSYRMLKACVEALHQAVLAGRGYEDSRSAAVVHGNALPGGRASDQSDCDRPGDRYNAAATSDSMLSLLQQHGWSVSGQGADGLRLCRPGKSGAVSATLYPDGTLYCFTSSTPFPAEKGVSPFAVYATLEHGGDHAAAASAIARDQQQWLSDIDITDILATAPGSSTDDGDCSRITVREPEEDAETEEPEAVDVPSHLLDVPGFIGDVLKHTIETAPRPQPVLALFGAICLQAVLAGRKISDPYGNRTNLYVVGLAKSGKGKNHPRVVNRQILAAAGLESLEGPEDLASDSGLIQAVSDSPSCLLQLDEMGRLLKAAGAAGKGASHLYGINTQLMRLYSSASTTFAGKAYADSKKNKTINQPCLTVYGTTVAEAFWGAMNSDSLSDGFLARLLPAVGIDDPERQRARTRRLPAYIVDRAQWWARHVPGGDLAMVNPDPEIYEYTPEAERLADTWADKWEAEGDKSDEWQPVWARSFEKACRLALVYAASRDPRSPVIDSDAINWACELSDITTRQFVESGNQHLADSEFQLWCKQVLALLRKRGKKGIGPARMGYYKPFNRLNPRQQDEVMTHLFRYEKIARAKSANGSSVLVLKQWATE